MKNAECRMKNEALVDNFLRALHFSFCILHSSLCIFPTFRQAGILHFSFFINYTVRHFHIGVIIHADTFKRDHFPQMEFPSAVAAFWIE